MNHGFNPGSTSAVFSDTRQSNDLFLTLRAVSTHRTPEYGKPIPIEWNASRPDPSCDCASTREYQSSQPRPPARNLCKSQRMTERFSGKWWRPDRPAHTASGELAWGDLVSPQLTLLDPPSHLQSDRLPGAMALGFDEMTVDVIHGRLVDGRAATLLGARIAGLTLGGAAIHRHSIRRALVGGDLLQRL